MTASQTLGREPIGPARSDRAVCSAACAVACEGCSPGGKCTARGVGSMTRRCLMATVVRYDVPAGWAAFVRQERVPGVWATAEEAQCATDDRHTAKG